MIMVFLTCGEAAMPCSCMRVLCAERARVVGFTIVDVECRSQLASVQHKVDTQAESEANRTKGRHYAGQKELARTLEP